MDSDTVPYAPVAGNERGPDRTADRSASLAGIARLLIVAPNWLGDAVMALPAIADLRRGAPDALLTVAARPHVAPLFSMAPGVNAVLPLDARRSVARDADAIRGGAYDAAVLLPNSWRTGLTAWRAGVPERWGYRTSLRGPLLTFAPAPPADGHQAMYYQRLATALGASPGPLVATLVAGREIRQAAADLLARAGWDGTRPLVALAPGAAYGSAKRWPAASYAELASDLARDGALPVLVGGPVDRGAGAEVIAGLTPGTAVIDLIGRTDLQALAGVLASCRMLVSNDSGAMHVASALGVPVTALFGPTDDAATYPIGPAPWEVLTHPVWCRPCMLRECPLDHRCMTGIRVEAALEAARRSA